MIANVHDCTQSQIRKMKRYVQNKAIKTTIFFKCLCQSFCFTKFLWVLLKRLWIYIFIGKEVVKLAWSALPRASDWTFFFYKRRFIGNTVFSRLSPI